MATSHDNEGTMEIAASLVACTAGTLVHTATSRFAYLPMTTCTSGNAVTVKFAGLVKGVGKTTSAWLAGESLTVGTDLTFAVTTALDYSQANAYGPAGAAATTGDIILRMPCKV